MPILMCNLYVSVYYMLHWCNISRIVIKSVTRPGAAGFVHCPPITCPLPPIWEIGSFSPSCCWCRQNKTISGCILLRSRLLLKGFVSFIDRSLDLKFQISFMKFMEFLNFHTYMEYDKNFSPQRKFVGKSVTSET